MARSSWFAIIRSYHLRRIAARSLAVLARHAGKARLAASMAARVSVAENAGMVPITCPSAGFTTSVVRPDFASSQLPVHVALLAEQRLVLEEDALHDLGGGSAHGAVSLRSADWGC